MPKIYIVKRGNAYHPMLSAGWQSYNMFIHIMLGQTSFPAQTVELELFKFLAGEHAWEVMIGKEEN